MTFTFPVSGLNLVSKINGKTFLFLAPDTLYQHFIEFTSLLLPNTTYWTFGFVTLLYNALSVELQETIRRTGYILTNNVTLSLFLIRRQLYNPEREISYSESVTVWGKKLVVALINSISPHKLSLTLFEAVINPMYSHAEIIIRAYHPWGGNSRNDRSLVKGPDGKLYPRNLIKNYAKHFADGFSGYLGCGSEAHLFKDYPDRVIKEIKTFVHMYLPLERPISFPLCNLILC